ncbi:MAG: hypothetical protein AAF203_02545, partial [Pseudomonadota bacterium]
MKILFVTNCLPSYPTNGAIIQTHHFMRLLAKKHQVGLWSYSNEEGPNYDLGLLTEHLQFLHVERKIPAKNLAGKLHRWSQWISGEDPMARWSYDGDRVTESLHESFEKFDPDVILFE